MQMNSEIEQRVEVWGFCGVWRRVLRTRQGRVLFLHDRTFAATSCIGRVLVIELISSSVLTVCS
jgi:hypothetical protein